MLSPSRMKKGCGWTTKTIIALSGSIPNQGRTWRQECSTSFFGEKKEFAAYLLLGAARALVGLAVGFSVLLRKF